MKCDKCGLVHDDDLPYCPKCFEANPIVECWLCRQYKDALKRPGYNQGGVFRGYECKDIRCRGNGRF
jgi:hypothetical protein